MFAAFAFMSYQCSTEYNPVTGEEQHIAISPEQEIAMGLKAAPQMAAQHGGLHPDQRAQELVDRVGQRLVQSSRAGETEWEFDFHLLADPQTVNAFALPGGQIFVTAALFNRFDTEGELAGVLGHEIGHVVARHSAQRIAKQQLTQGLTGAVLVASGGGGGEAQLAAMVGQMINMKYGREDELQSDSLGVLFMSQAGYDPRSLIEVMRILDEAAGGEAPPEWMSTHPSHGNRVETIQAAIDKVYPDGVPDGMIK
jgi:predicted Zn-dependent protease